MSPKLLASDPDYELYGRNGTLQLFEDRVSISKLGAIKQLFGRPAETTSFPLNRVREITFFEGSFIEFPCVVVRRVGDYGPLSTEQKRGETPESLSLAKDSATSRVHTLLQMVESFRVKNGLDPFQTPLMEVDGNDAKVTLYSDRLVLSQKGVNSKLNKGSLGAQEILLHDISGIQLKKPGLGRGYFQVHVSGHKSARGGILAAVRDELSVTLVNDRQYDRFLTLKTEISELMARPRTVVTIPANENISQNQQPQIQASVVLELERLVSLRNSGAISEQEFDEFKARLLR